MRATALACLCLLLTLTLALALPALYDMALLQPIARTHLFYSPVLRQCVYTEQLRGYDPAAAAKSEGHHADIVYKDESGNYYDRLSFEAALPFIYFRNMEMRGLLPIQLEGKSLDRAAIERARRVLELPARHLDGKRPPQNCLPLIESDPGQVALRYPTDRFRLTPQGMSFTNADTNAPEPALDALCNNALREAGFVFPAGHVGGNFTTFKPWEGGIFLVDAQGALFHLVRRGGKAEVQSVPLPNGVRPRHVLVSESREGCWLGFLLDDKARIWLIRQEREQKNAGPTIRLTGLVGLDVPGYLPERMDLKLIFNPLHLTVISSDESRIQAAVFALPPDDTPHGTLLQPFHSFSHLMSRARESWQGQLAATLFPFRLNLTSEGSTLLQPSLSPSPHWLSRALPFSLALAALWLLWQRRRSRLSGRCWLEGTFIAVCGLYGLFSLWLLRDRE